jgi:hypothetical protein
MIQYLETLSKNQTKEAEIKLFLCFIDIIMLINGYY